MQYPKESNNEVLGLTGKHEACVLGSCFVHRHKMSSLHVSIFEKRLKSALCGGD
jgi:hypothetical protein